MAHAERNTHATSTDLFDRVGEHPDLFESIDLELMLKEDIYELVGAAIKDAMRLREGFPVRLTAARLDGAGVSDEIGTGSVIDVYLAETGSLIEAYFAQIAGRIASFVNDDLG